MAIEMELGMPYVFTLQSGKKRTLILHGSSLTTEGFEIDVDGSRKNYGNIQDAIGEPWTKIEKKDSA